MQSQNDIPKPIDAEQPPGKGLDETPCCASSAAPGWVIIHPNGWWELDYFRDTLTSSRDRQGKTITVTPEEWVKQWRPRCTLRRGTINLLHNAIGMAAGAAGSPLPAKEKP